MNLADPYLRVSFNDGKGVGEGLRLKLLFHENLPVNNLGKDFFMPLVSMYSPCNSGNLKRKENVFLIISVSEIS